RYAHAGSEGATISFKARYGHSIGDAFVPPVKAAYSTNTPPVNGHPNAEFRSSNAEDLDKALDAARAAA
ncbi:aldehyde dehydrogenase family protein, partial [Pseudomonas aeruginosa]